MRELAAAIFLCAAAASAQEWRAAERELRDAYRQKNHAVMKAAAEKMAQQRGAPADLYNLACAEALTGSADAALAHLKKLAPAGLSFDIAADPDLGALRTLPGFSELVEQFRANAKPVGAPRKLSSLPAGLLPEDVAHDAKTGRTFVSSVRQRKIVIVAADGTVKDFVPGGRDGLWAVLGLALDPARRTLWATTAAMPFAVGFDKADANRTALVKLDLDSGRLLAKLELPKSEAPQSLGDLTVGPRGDVYASDSHGPLYVLRAGAEKPEVLVARGTFASPQTPAASPDGKLLFVPDYARGIAVVELESKKVRWLDPAGAALDGIDGLYLDKGALIAVQNGTQPRRVARFTLDAGATRVEKWEALDSNTPNLGEPTHGVIVGDELRYLASSGWDRYGNDGSEKKNAAADAPELRAVSLADPAKAKK
jgi:sugar lactone lactonase YvrE